jgi:hypothetical protein
VIILRDKIRSKYTFYVIIISVLLCNSNFTKGETVWEDTFDNSDSLNDWDVGYGNWIVDNGALTVTDCEKIDPNHPPSPCVTSIWHEQTSMTGTWGIDILHSGTEDFGTLFYFIGNGVHEWGVNYYPSEGYAIHVWGNSKIDLDYVKEGAYQNSPGEYSPPEQLTGWMHFEIIRNDSGNIRVYLNNTEIINADQNLVTSSENINIQTEVGVKLDNIRYSGNENIESSETTNSGELTTNSPAITSSVSSRMTSTDNANWQFIPFLFVPLIYSFYSLILHVKRKK